MRRVRHSLLLAGLATGALPLRGQSPGSAPDSLAALLRTVAAPLTLDGDGKLAGPAGDALAARVRRAQFVLLGEEHGVAQVPQLGAALWRAGAAHRDQHLAIEVGEQMAAGLEAALRADTTGAAYRQFTEEHWPGAPFYFWQEDAALLRTVIHSTPGERGVLWGLDYDILADRHLPERLRQLATTAAGRRLVDSAAAVMDSGLERALREQNPGFAYMFGGSPALFARLRDGLHPAAGSEGDRILALMEETLAINRLFFAGSNYESNLRRATLLKRQFLRRYDAARAATGHAPWVLLKFGADHLMRGVNPVNQFDLGTLVPGLAETSGQESLSLYVMGGAGSLQAQIDPRVLRSVEVPVDHEASDCDRAFRAAADSTQWTIFDLRAVRPALLQFAALPAGCREVLYGVDLVVVLTGSGPQHDLVGGRPARR